MLYGAHAQMLLGFAMKVLMSVKTPELQLLNGEGCGSNSSEMFN